MPAADAFFAHRARHFAEGQRPAGNRAGFVADCAVSGRDADDWHQTLPADAGLTQLLNDKINAPRLFIIKSVKNLKTHVSITTCSIQRHIQPMIANFITPF